MLADGEWQKRSILNSIDDSFFPCTRHPPIILSPHYTRSSKRSCGVGTLGSKPSGCTVVSSRAGRAGEGDQRPAPTHASTWRHRRQEQDARSRNWSWKRVHILTRSEAAIVSFPVRQKETLKLLLEVGQDCRRHHHRKLDVSIGMLYLLSTSCTLDVFGLAHDKSPCTIKSNFHQSYFWAPPKDRPSSSLTNTSLGFPRRISQYCSVSGKTVFAI